MIRANDVADSPLCAADICLYIIRGGRVTVPTNLSSVLLHDTIRVYSCVYCGLYLVMA